MNAGIISDIEICCQYIETEVRVKNEEEGRIRIKGKKGS